MPRDDGVRYGAGGQVMQEIVELPKQEKSISKIALLNSIIPLSNNILVFFIDELLEEISLEKDFVSRS